MTRKKQIILGLIVFAAIFSISMLSISFVNAVDISGKLTNVGDEAGFEKNANLPQTIGQIIKALLSIIGIVFMGYVIYAGQLWMTARGNEEQITKAKAIIRGSIIGLLIVMLAYAITAFVVSNVVSSTGYNPSVQQG